MMLENGTAFGRARDMLRGITGANNTGFNMQTADFLRARQDKVLVCDRKGSLMTHYFHEATDILLNPFDARCCRWDLWREAPTDADFEKIANTLIPAYNHSDPFWVNAARAVFADLASTMRQDKNRSLTKFLNLLLCADFFDLAQYLEKTLAASLLHDKTKKSVLSIRAVLSHALKPLQTFADVEKRQVPVFSIRDYLLADKAAGWLFIASPSPTETCKPLTDAWLCIARRTLSDLSPEKQRQTWFIHSDTDESDACI